MSFRWDGAWPIWAPKKLAITRPVCEYVRKWAKITPHRFALSFYGYDITYSDLDVMIDKLAVCFLDLGLEKGDRVAVHMQNCPQFVLAFFAIQRAGGVVVPVNPMFKGAELEHEMNDSGAMILIGLDSLYHELKKVIANTRIKQVILTSLNDFLPSDPIFPLSPDEKGIKKHYPDTLDLIHIMSNVQSRPVCEVHDLQNDLALLQYTGGTTGKPKGAVITHFALASAAVGSTEWYRHRETDVMLGVTPFFHVMGQVNLMCAAAVCGGRLAILSRFNPNVAAQAIAYYKVTFWVAAIPMIISLLDFSELRAEDLASFRCIVTGGASVPVELQTRLAEMAPQAAIVEGYGLSETTSSGGACTPLYQYKPGFVGIPQINVEMKIVDQETKTKEMPPNQEGEIIIKAASMMLGYWQNEEETKNVLKDGWLYTGDTGLMDENGYIKFLGRTRELIKCSGFSVFPSEVEDLLFLHPAVKESAVIGIPDSYRGESPKAFIVLKDDFVGRVTEQEILDWCKDNMATYKRPRFVEFKTKLPKSNAGKLLRRLLVKDEQELGDRD